MNYTDLIAKATELASQMATKYGPVAWETTLTVLRLDALYKITVWMFFFIAFLILYKTYWKKWGVWANEHQDKNIARYVVAGFCIIPLTITSVGEGLWTWIQLFYPELYLAHEALERVLR